MKLITQSTLIGRDGWSKKTILEFYAKPEKEVKNPHYSKGEPIKLYDFDKVLAIELMAEFKSFGASVEKNKERGRKAAQTKSQRLLAYIDSLVIEVPEIEKNELIKLACDRKNQWYAFKRGENITYFDDELGYRVCKEYTDATPESSPDFLARIVTNYLRHQLNCYESNLIKIFGKVGSYKAYGVLKFKVNQAIWAKYPWASEYARGDDSENWDE